MNASLIGLTGMARVGKDTAAMRLWQVHRFWPLAFADPIKRGLSAAFGLDKGIFDGPEKEQEIDWLGVSPRYLMQRFGTQFGREMVAEDVWLRMAGRRLAQLQHHQAVVERERRVVVTDVRFDNEAAWVREQGGMVLRVTRSVKPVADHESEYGVSPELVDVSVSNNGTLDEFYARIDDVVRERFGRLAA